MKNLCIIPARGGSKRIPRKNIKPFLGKPIIAYSIEVALASGLFDEVMVSTDDEEIAEVARQYGAKVPFMRSAKTSDDWATTADVLLEVLEEYQNIGTDFKYGCCIYPTAPLLKQESLEEAHKLLVNEKYDSVFPVVEFSYPIWRSLKFKEAGKVVMNWPEHLNKRSQDLPKAYHDAGQFYWLDVSSFFQKPILFSDNSGVVVLGDLEVQDIDSAADWKLAELKAKL